MLKHYLVATVAAFLLITAVPASAETPTNTGNTAVATTTATTGNTAETVTTAGTNTAKTVTTEATGTAGTVATGEEAKPDATFEATGEGLEGQLSDEQMTQAVDAMIQAVGDEAGPFAFLALLCMFIGTLLKNMVLPRVNMDKKWTPVATMGVSCLAAVGYCMWAGVPVLEALPTVALAVATAVGGYEMVVKHVMALVKSDKEAEA
jgi:hypothetical protein